MARVGVEIPSQANLLLTASATIEARVGVVFDLNLLIPTESRPFFLGVGFRGGDGASTVIGSGGVFFGALDDRIEGYVRIAGGADFFEASVGALLASAS